MYMTDPNNKRGVTHIVRHPSLGLICLVLLLVLAGLLGLGCHYGIVRYLQGYVDTVDALG